MDFVSGFPLTQKKHDSVWVIVNRLTKSTRFLPIRLDYSIDRLAELYVNEIVQLHGIPLLIQIDGCFVLISMPNSIPKRRNYSRLAL